MPAPSPLPGFAPAPVAPSADPQVPAWNTDYTFAGWFTPVYGDGVSGGQTIIGGTDAGDDLELKSTSHATAGHVIITGCGLRLDNNQRISWFNAAGTFVRDVVYLNASNQTIITGVPDGGGDVQILSGAGTTLARFVGSAVQIIGGSLSSAGLRIGTTTANTGWSGSSNGCAFAVGGVSIIDLNGFGVKVLSRTDANRGSASTASAGRAIYNTDQSRLQFSDGTNWQQLVTVVDLTAGLAGKADAVHTHSTSDITGFDAAAVLAVEAEPTLDLTGALSVSGVVAHTATKSAVTALVIDDGETEIDWADGNFFTLELTEDIDVLFANPAAGQTIKVFITQDDVGARVVVNWPAEIRWAGGAAPTLTATPEQADCIVFSYDGTNMFGCVGGQDF